MTSFPIVATVISMVLGLSITRLLLGIVTIFRIRHTSAVDWVPLMWSAVLFNVQLQYWWAINNLSLMHSEYSFIDFLFMVLMTLMLFLASALLLPSRSEDEAQGLRAYFEADGRFALLALSGYLLFGFVSNVFYFSVSPLEAWGYSDIPMIALPIVACLNRRRNVYTAITAIYVPLAVWDTYISLIS